MRKRRIKNWVKIVICMFVLAILFSNPFTRTIIRIILPLGSGVDDIIVLFAMIIGVIVLIVKSIQNRRKIQEWCSDDEHQDDDNYQSY